MRHLQGIAAAPGVALGPAHCIRPAAPVDSAARRTAAAAAELARFDAAQAGALAHLDELMAMAHEPALGILTTQRELLADATLGDGARDLITWGLTTEAAVMRVVASHAAHLAALPDPLKQAAREPLPTRRARRPPRRSSPIHATRRCAPASR